MADEKTENPKADRGAGRGQIEPRSDKESEQHLMASGLMSGFLAKETPARQGEAAVAAEEDVGHEPAPAEQQETSIQDEDVATPEDGSSESSDKGEGSPDVRAINVGGVDYELPSVLAEHIEKGTLRQSDYSRKTQKVADERKAVEAERGVIQQEREKYAGLLTRLEKAIEEIVPSTPPDWNAVRQDDPEGFSDRFATWTIQSQQREAVKAARLEAEGKVTEDRAEARRLRLVDERRLLEEKIPELFDPEKGAVLERKITAYARDTYQLPPELLGSIDDHRFLDILNKARLYDAARTGLRLVQGSERPAVPRRPPIRVLRPGATSESSSEQVSRKTVMEKAANRLAKTGAERDAAEFLLAGGFLKG
jgi:hypothetical protein